MISSAVVIPESTREPTPPPTYSLKRRLSHSPSIDSKRPRVEVDELNYDEPQNKSRSSPTEPARSRPSTRTDSATAMSPPRRKSSLLTGTNATEEKKRSKRLFGGLLGTLSQTTSKPANKKRDEIEARQRERIRQQAEEEEERRNQRKRELDRQRRDQQKVWDDEAMRQRHRNMRNMAGYLRTKAEPRLYYKPWELRPSEEDDIETQKAAAEHIIRRELGEDDQMDDRPAPSGKHEDRKHQDPRNEPVKNEREPEPETDGDPMNSADHDKDAEMQSQHVPELIKEEDESGKQGQTTMPMNDSGHERQSIQEDVPKEEDQHDEELVEGQEDDVIY